MFNGAAVAVLGGEPLEHQRHAVQPRRVDVVQDDLVEPERLRFGEQRAVDERDAEAAAADDRELHATVTSIPAASAKTRVKTVSPIA